MPAGRRGPRWLFNALDIVDTFVLQAPGEKFDPRRCEAPWLIVSNRERAPTAQTVQEVNTALTQAEIQARCGL